MKTETISDTLKKFGFIDLDGNIDMTEVNRIRKPVCKNCNGTGIVKDEMAGEGCVIDCLWCKNDTDYFRLTTS